MASSFVTPWTVAHPAPLSMGFPRQEFWGGLPFPSPGGLTIQGLSLCLLHGQVDSLLLSHQEAQKDDTKKLSGEEEAPSERVLEPRSAMTVRLGLQAVQVISACNAETHSTSKIENQLMRKLRHRKVKQFTPNYTAIRCYSWIWA